MKSISKTFVTLFAIAIFVILNWATSQDEIAYIELQADAMLYQDTLLILDNQDDLAINNATLILNNSEAVTVEVSYMISNYSLGSFSRDTIELVEFTNGPNQPYPDSIRPTEFILDFEVSENNAFAGFTTQL